MLTKKWKAIMFCCALTTACDQARGEASWRHEEPDLAVDGDDDAIDRERIEEAFAQQTWDEALKELLDLECDGRGRCTWVWSDLDAVGLEELVDELPEPPAEEVELQPSGHLTAVPDPSEVYIKRGFRNSCGDLESCASVKSGLETVLWGS